MFELGLDSSLDLALPKLSKLYHLIFKNFLVVRHCNVQLLFIDDKSVQPSIYNVSFLIHFDLEHRMSWFQFLSSLDEFVKSVIAFI